MLLEEDRRGDMKLMYELFSRVKNGLSELKTAFAEYVKVIMKESYGMEPAIILKSDI